MRVSVAWLVCWLVSAAAAAEPVTTIRSNGDSANRVDIVVMGDGYTAAEIASGKYAQDVETFVTGLFGQNPWSDYRNYFNVHRVDVTSVESGADKPARTPPIFRATALDASYDCNGITRLICVNLSKVNAVLSRTSLGPAARDVILVIVNDTEYGGSGGAVAVSSINSSAVEIVLHELGHSLGLLADEYGGPPPPSCVNNVEPSAANATSQTIRSQIKWNAWISPSTPVPTTSPVDGVPGLFQGAMYCDTGLYRPTFNSKMRTLGVPYYQVNTEQLLKRFHNYVSPIDSVAPAVASVTVPAGSAQIFSVATPQPLSHPLTYEWRLDGIFVASSPEYVVNISAGSGIHTLEIQVSDPTPLVRQDPAGLLRATRSWSVRVLDRPGGDFDGDGKADITVFRPDNGTWYTRQSSTSALSTVAWGVSTDIPVPGDYDGDGKADVAVYRPSTGTWYILASSAGFSTVTWGAPGDIPVPADYDRDRKSDIAVYRPSTGTWYLLGSTAGFSAVVWGVPGDIPVEADYDGDSAADIGVYRPSTGTWYIIQSSDGTIVTHAWGAPGDVPVVGDFDGDTRSDVAVYRPGTGTWYILASTAGFISVTWGVPDDIPVPADFDGDNISDIAVYRPSSGTWFILQSSTKTLKAVPWGVSGDIPIFSRQ